MEFIYLLIQFGTLLCFSYYFYFRYKKNIKKYVNGNLKVSYDEVIVSIATKYKIKCNFIFSNKITEVSYISAENRIIIPHKYKVCSLWSIAQIYRELDYKISGLSIKKRPYLIRNFINRMLFYYLLFAGWVYGSIIFINDALLPLILSYLIPILLIFIANSMIRYNHNCFAQFLMELKIDIGNDDSENLVKWVYKQPKYLMLSAYSKQIAVLKWLFKN